MKVKNPKFTAIIQEFTRTTYIMVVFRNIQSGAIEFNLKSAQKIFEQNKSEKQNLLFDWNNN